MSRVRVFFTFRISEFVPQKIMCNCVFVIDLKKLESENALFKDGLGSWIQNCGKVMNYFVMEEGSAIRVNLAIMMQ